MTNLQIFLRKNDRPLGSVILWMILIYVLSNGFKTQTDLWVILGSIGVYAIIRTTRYLRSRK